MKTISALFLVLGFATAFVPSLRNQRPRTAAFMLLEPDGIQHVTEHATDALRMIMLDCDKSDCTMVEGWRDNTPDHNWHYNNKLDGNVWGGPAPDHKITPIMYEYDDCE